MQIFLPLEGKWGGGDAVIILILSLSNDEDLMVRQAHHEVIGFTLALPPREGGDVQSLTSRR